MAGRLARNEHRPEDVCLPHTPEVCDCRLNERGPMSPSRVVDQHVVAAQLGNHSGDHSLHFVLVGDIGNNRQCTELRSRFIERVSAPAAYRDFGASVSQQLRRGVSNPRASASHQCFRLFQVHRFLQWIEPIINFQQLRVHSRQRR